MIVKILFAMFLSFIVYVSLVGSIEFDELVIGLVISFLVALLTKDLLVKDERKVMSVRRWLSCIWYLTVYWLYFEVLAHWNVVKRVFTMDIRPGIVRVPYYLDTEYGVISVANSITNTPGTVVVEVDEEERRYYIHWINATSTEEEGCYERISKAFEKYVRRFM
ncbi:MAG: cation:proton antiporter [Candidatus Verstraetearchaeota archaeon]|nr:cation:proton antiporter [Candidatus Verstraetearchaeota archaeon]